VLGKICWRAFGRYLPWREIQAVSAIILVLCFTLYPLNDSFAAPVKGRADSSKALVKSGGKLAEAAPPEVIQELRKALDEYQPQVSILSPKPNEVLSDNTVAVRFQVKDLPIFKDPGLELGPHLHVFLDNEPYRPVYDLNQPLVFDNLAPGTHTLRVFASRPWHESFKNEGAYAQLTFHVFTKTGENSPDVNLPLLTYSRPQGAYGAEPILLDFYLTNAPLHLVAQETNQDDIADWRIRVTINGNSFVLDRWQPVYLKGFQPGKNWVQLEFLDEKGNPLNNVFNNTVRVITYEPGGKDGLSRLMRGDLTLTEARGIVDPTYQPPVPEPQPTKLPEVSPSPAVSPQVSPTPAPVIVREKPAPVVVPAPIPVPSVPVQPVIPVVPPVVKEVPTPAPTVLPTVEKQRESTKKGPAGWLQKFRKPQQPAESRPAPLESPPPASPELAPIAQPEPDRTKAPTAVPTVIPEAKPVTVPTTAPIAKPESPLSKAMNRFRRSAETPTQPQAAPPAKTPQVEAVKQALPKAAAPKLDPAKVEVEVVQEKAAPKVIQPKPVAPVLEKSQLPKPSPSPATVLTPSQPAPAPVAVPSAAPAAQPASPFSQARERFRRSLPQLPKPAESAAKDTKQVPAEPVFRQQPAPKPAERQPVAPAIPVAKPSTAPVPQPSPPASSRPGAEPFRAPTPRAVETQPIQTRPQPRSGVQPTPTVTPKPTVTPTPTVTPKPGVMTPGPVNPEESQTEPDQPVSEPIRSNPFSKAFKQFRQALPTPPAQSAGSSAVTPVPVKPAPTAQPKPEPTIPASVKPEVRQIPEETPELTQPSAPSLYRRVNQPRSSVDPVPSTGAE